MGYYFVIGISCLIIGFLAGLLISLRVRRKPTSSATPGADPMPSEVLTEEFVKKVVERTIQDYEEKKTTVEIVKDINKLLEEETP